MIDPINFIEEGKKRNFTLYTGVPCSYLKPFINYVIDSSDIDYVAAANEGDAIAVGAGAALNGLNPVVMFQNSGLGNAVNPLTSLIQTFEIPCLLIITLRGEPGGPKDEPQHRLMGKITTDFLDLMEIHWDYFPTDDKKIINALDTAQDFISKGKPYALVMKKGSVNSYELKTNLKVKDINFEHNSYQTGKLASRESVLREVQDKSLPNDLLIATTGYTGRELYAIGDKNNQLYLVGSMGCASSLGLGLAITSKKNRIIVLDGDGALLMRLGALATVGYYQPKNFLHVLLDNETHESTGGQSTVSHSLDFKKIAVGCGYKNVLQPTSLSELGQIVNKNHDELTFCYVRTEEGVMNEIPRPSISPKEVAIRFRNHIKNFNE